jgi:hypothetical protein
LIVYTVFGPYLPTNIQLWNCNNQYIGL